jgi:hypothetical protein
MPRLTKVVEKASDPSILPVIFGNVSKKKVSEKEKSKLEMFEKGLGNELSSSDTIEQSVEKIVKMALAAEFGATLVTKPGAKNMINTISRGIMSDSQLRRSALIIADKFSTSGKTKIVSLRGRKKAVLNG